MSDLESDKSDSDASGQHGETQVTGDEVCKVVMKNNFVEASEDDESDHQNGNFATE